MAEHRWSRQLTCLHTLKYLRPMSHTQQSWATLSCNTLLRQSCLSDLASFKTVTTNFLDRNHLHSSSISHSVAQLWSTLAPMNFCLYFLTSADTSHTAPKQCITDSYVVICVTSSCDFLAIVCQSKTDSFCLFVVQSCTTLLHVWHGPY